MMQQSPNRSKMSPLAVMVEENGLRGRWWCPCCGGSMGIRAAFRPNPRVEYQHYKGSRDGEKIPFNRMIGRKDKTLRNHRDG